MSKGLQKDYIYRATEWEIILAAYSYEILDKPIMNDSTFDYFCKALKLPTKIKGFSPDTGQWIHDLLPDLDLDVLNEAHTKALKLGQNTRIDWLIPTHLIEDFEEDL